MKQVKEIDRPNFDEYCMMLVKLISVRSTCLRRNVGAILVKDKQIIATGYNGAPKNAPHCEEVGCLRKENNIPSDERHEMCRGGHAEANAVSQSAQHGGSTEGSILYCTTFPCPMCVKTLINAGIKKIVYESDYDTDGLSANLMKQSGIEFEQMEIPKISKYMSCEVK